MMAKTQFTVCEEDIVHAGFLLKESKVLRRLRSRWIVLTRESLSSFKTLGQHQQPTEALQLRECSSVRSADFDTGLDNSIYVVTPDRTFLLVADSRKEKEAWINAISNCCLPVLLGNRIRHKLCLFSIVESEDSKQWDLALPVRRVEKENRLKNEEPEPVCDKDCRKNGTAHGRKFSKESTYVPEDNDVACDSISDDEESDDEEDTSAQCTELEQTSYETDAATSPRLALVNCSLAAEFLF
mmetsp:Transcript_53697/g.96523  ORF Transcript_53697/g.96523 Transcript_53697/m.96523 type:complete len:241 (-) Transcript_53697:250-972(-)